MSQHKRPFVFTFVPTQDMAVTLVTRLSQWEANWRAAGYHPQVIIPLPDRMPHFAASIVEHLSTTNANMPTFLKWLALASACPVDAFCMFAHYNVFNYGFIPDMNAGRLASKGVNILYDYGTTNVIFGGKAALLKQCALFGHFTPGPDQVFTDLDVLKHQEVNAPEMTVIIPDCIPYRENRPGLRGMWTKAQLVRFDDLSLDPRALRDWDKQEATV